MRCITFLLLLVVCFCPVIADARVEDSPPEQDETMLAYGIEDYLPFFKKPSAREIEITDPELSFLQVSNISSASAAITWVSATPCAGMVEYGTTTDLGEVAGELTIGQVHFLQLKGLPAEQTVYYRVICGEAKTPILRFRTAEVGAGLPRVVCGALRHEITPSVAEAIAKLKVMGPKGMSLPLATRFSRSGIWMLNLGNLKSTSGQVFSYHDDMTAQITVEGIGPDGKPAVLLSYKVRLGGIKDGDLSRESGVVSRMLSSGPAPVSSPWIERRKMEPVPIGPQPAQISPEREFLEQLMSKGAQARREGRKGHGQPHIIPGWRGGKSMGLSKPPEPGLVPNRLHLQGMEVLKEIVKLRQERSDAREFFPDVTQHFLHLRLGKDVVPVPLYEGINIVALPVDPYVPVGSYSFLQDVENAQEVTAWDGELQQFGASAWWVGEEIVGTDFPFELGYGYFVTMDSSGEASFEGDPLTSIEVVSIHAGLEVISLVGSSDSVTSYTVFDELFSGSEICRINPEMQSYECAFREPFGAVFGEEFLLEEGTGYFVRTEEQGFFPSPEDVIPPSLTIVSPADGDEIYTRQPFVEIVFGDHEWGLDLSTFSCLINGEDKTSFFAVDEFGATWQMSGGEELAESTNVIEATIEDLFGNPRTVTSTFNVVTTPPPEDEHFVNGYVFHGDTWEPLEGVAVTVEDIPGVIYTDSLGHYVFPTPGLGEYLINIEKEHLTYAERHLLIEHGHGDVFVDDAYLSPRDSVVTRITPEGGVAVNSDGSVTVTFPAGIVEEDIDFSASNSYDQEDLPIPLPDRWVSLASISTWPEEIPFADKGDKGGKWDLFYDVILPRFFPPVIVYIIRHSRSSGSYGQSTSTTLQDNRAPFYESRSNYRRRRCVTTAVKPPPPPPTYPDGPPKIIPELSVTPKPPHGGCSSHGSPSLGDVKLKFGGSTVSHELPSVTSLGISRSLSFAYASHTVQPKAVVETGIDGIPEGYLLPQYCGAQLNTAGRRFTGIIEASRDTTSQRVRFDSKSADGEYLPTGAYYYNDVLSNFSYSQYATADSFGGPPTDTTGVWTDFPVNFRDRVGGNLTLVDNRLSSNIGSGWALNGLQRLYFRPDDDAMIVEGGGVSHFYDRIYAVPILDLAVPCFNQYLNGWVDVRLGDGAGGFGDQQNYQVGRDPVDIATGDFNGDEVLDLAVTNAWYSFTVGYVSVLLGNGTGGFGDRQNYEAIGSPCGIVTADFNGDSLLDLAIADSWENTSYVSIFMGDGVGGFGDRQDYLAGPWLYELSYLAVGDFNRDGLPDLAHVVVSKDKVSVRLNDGGGGFSDRQDYPVGDSPWDVVTGDFNRDGLLDLAVTNAHDDDVSVLLGDGAGGFGNRQDYPVGNCPKHIVTGDFNGNGVLDLANTNYLGNDVSVLLGDGAGGFGDRQDYQVGSYPRQIVTGDFNGDSLLDLAVVNPMDEDVSVLMGVGAGLFGDRQDYSTGEPPRSIVTDNFNGDYYIPGFRSKEGDFTKLVFNPDTAGYIRVYPDSSKVVFDSAGLHIATIDRNGNTTTYEYDELNRLIAVTYPGNMVIDLEYDPDGYLETVTDPAGRVTHFNHDPDGNLISVTDPDGSVWQYEYDDEHLLTKTIDPRENETAYDYDSAGYVIQITGTDSSTNDFLGSDAYNTLNEAVAQGQGTPGNPADVVRPHELINRFVNTQGDTTASLTNAYGRRTTKLDPLGRLWKFGYNDDGFPTIVNRPDTTFMAYTWTEVGQIASVRDSSSGAVTTYEYDSVFNRLTMAINAVGDTTFYELDERGNTVRTINALWDTTSYSYDSRGLRTMTINALGDSTLYFYDSKGNLDSLINPLGYVTKYEYDDAGNQTAVIDPLGNRTEYEYDANGRMILMRDPLGNETQYIYDPGLAKGCCGSGGGGNLLLATISPMGDTTRYEYDEMDRLIKTIDPLGNISRTEYDEEGRVTKRIDPEGRWIAYSYDDAGNLISQTDSLGRTTTHEYESRNRRIKTIDPNGGETRYVYSDVGNLLHFINADGETNSFEYDLLNRKISETDPLNRTKHFRYNPLGGLDTLITAKGDVIVSVYDDLGRLIEKQYPLGGVSYQYDAVGNPLQIEDDDSRLVMTYDPNGQILTVTTGNPGNPQDPQPVTTIAYQYDAARRKIKMIDPQLDTTYCSYNAKGELDSLIVPDGGLFEFELDKVGRITEIGRPNGTRTSYGYDGSDQVLSIVHRSVAALIDSLVYSYNPVGMVELIIDDNNTSSYDYDSLDQVIAASYTDPLQTNEFFTYDSLGNRTSSHLSSNYDYDNANQIEEDDQYAYVFDTNGNMIEKEDQSTLDRWEYAYNYENRLIGVKKYDGGVSPPSLEAIYRYDGQGRRICEIVNSDTTVYIYNGSDILFEYNGSDLLIASYIQGPSVDQPLMVTRGDDKYYFHADKLGSIKALTDSTGAVVQTYLYDSFGNIKHTMSGDYFSPYTYTGREWDDESGLYYYRARYYDAEAGRFLQTDPSGYINGYNLYLYIKNSPVNNNDPSGLWFGIDDLLFTVGGAIIGAAEGILEELSYEDPDHSFDWGHVAARTAYTAIASEAFLYGGPKATEIVLNFSNEAVVHGTDFASYDWQNVICGQPTIYPGWEEPEPTIKWDVIGKKWSDFWNQNTWDTSYRGRGGSLVHDPYFGGGGYTHGTGVPIGYNSEICNIEDYLKK